MTQKKLSQKEVVRRLPALQYIDDNGVRSEVRGLSRQAPEYFWERPGSRRGYHNPHKHGLWKHTLKLCTVIDRLADSWVNQDFISRHGVDYAHAAAILHDQRKEGVNSGQTAKDHDLQMGEVVRQFSELDSQVARGVECHMGPWYDGPSPTPGTVEDLVHVADMIASAPVINVALPGPVPKELQPYTEQAVDVS